VAVAGFEAHPNKARLWLTRMEVDGAVMLRVWSGILELGVVFANNLVQWPIKLLAGDGTVLNGLATTASQCALSITSHAGGMLTVVLHSGGDLQVGGGQKKR
jgi:hypothetical protein